MSLRRNGSNKWVYVDGCSVVRLFDVEKGVKVKDNCVDYGGDGEFCIGGLVLKGAVFPFGKELEELVKKFYNKGMFYFSVAKGVVYEFSFNSPYALEFAKSVKDWSKVYKLDLCYFYYNNQVHTFNNQIVYFNYFLDIYPNIHFKSEVLDLFFKDFGDKKLHKIFFNARGYYKFSFSNFNFDGQRHILKVYDNFDEIILILFNSQGESLSTIKKTLSVLYPNSFSYWREVFRDIDYF